MTSIVFTQSWIPPKGDGSLIRRRSAESAAYNAMRGFGRESGRAHLADGGARIGAIGEVTTHCASPTPIDEAIISIGIDGFIHGLQDAGALGETLADTRWRTEAQHAARGVTKITVTEATNG